MKPLYRNLITAASVVVALGAIVAALWFVGRPQDPAPQAQTPQAQTPQAQQSEPAAPREAAPPAASASAAAPLTVAELAKHDGKNGNKCYIAVDKTVYLIEMGTLWQEGEHMPSNGRAMCGKDLSAVIDKAPHGRSKLPQLTVVGQLG